MEYKTDVEFEDFLGETPFDESSEDDEVYKLTPKGIALLSAMDAGLIDAYDDRQFEVFWKLFEYDMRKLGYVTDD